MKKENKVLFLFSIIGLFGFAYFLYALIPFNQFEYLVNSKRFGVFILYCLLATIYIIWGFNQGNRNSWETLQFPLLSLVPKLLRELFSLFFVILPIIIFLYIPTSNVSFTTSVRWVFSVSCIIWSVLIKLHEGNLKEKVKSIIITGVVLGTLFSLGQLFNQVTNYPFSLGWSEGNRLWDYSILFGSKRYTTNDGDPIYAFLDKGRALVWGWIYLIPNIRIWGVRFLDAVIKSIPYFGLGLVLIWPERKNISKNGLIIFVFWTFLFIRQGPIHTPLVISAIFTVLAVQNKNIWFSVIFLIGASYLAELSRFTWIYAPGLWAGMLSLLQIVNPSLAKGRWRELIKPIVLSLSGYFGGQILPTIIDKIKVPDIEKSFEIIIDFQNSTPLNQDLLWDRWLPNITYGPGILLSIFIVLLPVVIVLYWIIRSKKWVINWIQILGVMVPGLGFLIVGLIASVKIGGGGDLHNLDMLLIFLVLLIGINWQKIWEIFNGLQTNKHSFIFMSSLLLFPVFFSLRSGIPLTVSNDDRKEAILNIIQNEVDNTQENGGQVLFMDQRQLITFDFVKDVVLIDDYDKKVLINRTFNNDPEKFSAFYEDLANQRFSLILSNVLKKDLQYDNPFSEENNYWVEGVVIPILEYYQPSYTFEDLDIQLLIPIE